jgi:hypothetical protein
MYHLDNDNATSKVFSLLSIADYYVVFLCISRVARYTKPDQPGKSFVIDLRFTRSGNAHILTYTQCFNDAFGLVA